MTPLPSPTKHQIGKQGESIAEAYLLAMGYQLIQRNYRAQRCEIDLIMDDHGTIVFIEVKYRKNARFGSPQEAVHANKQKQIIKTAYLYLVNHDMEQVDCRFDVIAITDEKNKPVIQHFQDAFIATPESLSY